MEIPEVVAVKSLPDYSLYLEFSDGTKGETSVAHLAGKGVFAFWNDYRNFEKVYVDQESGTIAWSDDIDLDPVQLYASVKGISIEDMFSKKYA